MAIQQRAHRTPRQAAGVFATIVGVAMLAWGLFAPYAHGAFTTQLAAEAGQNPMPSAVTDVPEDCKGIAPTPGSQQDTTQKQLNEGQGIITPGTNSFDPGGTVHWLVLYNPTAKSASFDVRDCVVEFLPGNPHIADVLALIDPNGHGQIIPTPGSEPAVKGFDAVVDQAEFDFPDNVALPGEFDMSWTVPGAATPGALICNYAKDTGGSDVGGKENRKAGGACFSVPDPPTTTTTTTTTTEPPTTTSSTTTSTTTSTSTTSTTTFTPSVATTTTIPTSVLGEDAVATTTTVPTQVLGEHFGKVAFTGSDVRDVVLFAGALIVSGGLLLLASGRRRRLNG